MDKTIILEATTTGIQLFGWGESVLFAIFVVGVSALIMFPFVKWMERR